MPVPILKQGDCLIATIQATISDSDWRELQNGCWLGWASFAAGE